MKTIIATIVAIAAAFSMSACSESPAQAEFNAFKAKCAAKPDLQVCKDYKEHTVGGGASAS